MTLRSQSNSVVSSSFVPAGHRLGGGRTFRGQHLSSKQGFTLVELLIGATLSAAVMAAVLSSYIYVGRQLARLANQQILETEGRRTLANFSRDVRLASGLATVSVSPTSPATNRVDLTVPTGSSSNTVTYYYNNGVAAAVTISGSSITMAANSLTRCLYNGTTVTSLTLLRNINSSGLTIRYYDTSNNPYTTYTDYLSGIKQISLEFSTQLGTAGNGTQTKIYEVASNRLILRNRSLLP